MKELEGRELDNESDSFCLPPSPWLSLVTHANQAGSFAIDIDVWHGWRGIIWKEIHCFEVNREIRLEPVPATLFGYARYFLIKPIYLHNLRLPYRNRPRRNLRLKFPRTEAYASNV